MILLFFLLLFKSIAASDFFSYDNLYGHLRPKIQPQDSEHAVRGVIQRLIGERARSFEVKIVPKIKSNHRDVFSVRKIDDYVVITASSGVAAAWGFHYYLKEFLNCHISWDGDQISLPETLPDVDIKIVANDWFRYYQNVCTTSYSFVWWDWERWEREIDWMALNGFNLALAFNGQEEIWRRVYLKLGLTDKEIGEHFAGPAFLSWNRMGNLRGWGGSLSKSWHERSVNLQKRILRRMRELGITPVLPAFAGHVPRAFTRIFPSANLTLLPDWCDFPDQYCCPYILAPDDPTFNNVGSLFLNEYIQEFGTDHIYNCDPFNEMLPSSGDLDYLQRIGRSIYESINSTDPHGIWMLQSWTFLQTEFWSLNRSQSFLTSIPTGKFLVLDLQAEINPQYTIMDSFFGQPFIWCMLHNFGGTLGLHGSSDFINNNIFEAREFDNSTLVGVGITPEGINQNYVIYDLLMDMFWRKEPANLTEWFSNYARRRYGIQNIHTQNAWNLLKQSVYNYTGDEAQHGKYTVVQHPRLNMASDDLWYSETDVYDAWTELLQASSEIPERLMTETFLVDLVDVTRQALQLKANELFIDIYDAYVEGNLTALRKKSATFLELLDGLETILASNRKFLLGNWINSAKRIATTPLEEKIFERNARNQITLWGPNGEIRDYANKQWSGLVKDYYKPRWEIFLSALNDSLTTKTPFYQKKVSNKIFSDVEEHFSYSYFNYPDHPIGNSIAISRRIKKKLGQLKRFKN
ncbi:alpha-N-acetylglucosaminidase isoform X2 [Halyomorpha halys]|uniref:alpha-N-acetylglucosaminidase isoform X2 n=1 Tax=Halyomorpha halys TaxID=286706 RepID=UPI0006D4FA9B|nr:alpha-N-acetylglucosaminidase-like isoform X2 [Halyomorpha halys]